MGQESDAVRAEIDGTRDDMSQVVTAIGDKVSPKQMARRQTGRVRDRFTTVRTTVMGSAEDMAGSVQSAAGAAGGRAQDLGQSVQQAPQVARTQVQGNPLAAGLIAFGLGLLVASIIPASEPERQMAAKVGRPPNRPWNRPRPSPKKMKENLQTSAQRRARRRQRASHQCRPRSKGPGRLLRPRGQPIRPPGRQRHGRTGETVGPRGQSRRLN